MITLTAAKLAVEQYLKSFQKEFLTEEELVFDDSDITEFDLVWVFCFTTRKYKDAPNDDEKPILKPVMVSKDDGGIYIHLGPHHVNRVASEFDKNKPGIRRLV